MKTTKEKIFWGAVLIFGICCLYTFLLLNGLSYKNSVSYTPLAQITVIPGSVIPSPDIQLLELVTQTPTIDPSSPNGNGIQLGVYVQITGTGGSGLNIRNNPELGGEKNFIANESEIFKVIGGPITQNDYVWWQLSTPYDQSRQGWAVQDYLHLIEP